MNKKKRYFTVKQLKVLVADCNYLMLIGDRADGKSYSSKSYALEKALESIDNGVCKCQLGYIRRFDKDCKDNVLEPYFADMPISEISKGRYSNITVYRKKIYLGNFDEKTNKPTREVCIGQCFALASAEHYKSLMFPRIQTIIFEEVISQDNKYLTSQEPNKLQHLISSILRDRKGTVILIGNTLSRFNPYYDEWELIDAEHIKLGETRIYNFDGTIIKVHRCDSSKYNSGMFFGKSKGNITQGEYYTESQPHLDGDKKDYDIVHTIVLEYNRFIYLMEFLYNRKEEYYVWYVSPKTTPIKKGTRVISNKFNPSPLYTNDFIGVNAYEKKALEFIELRKVVFSDNLTGTEFYNIIDNFND